MSLKKTHLNQLSKHSMTKNSHMYNIITCHFKDKKMK